MTRLAKPIFGIDSYGETPPDVQHAIYSKFICRYSSRTTGKAITKAEYDTYKNNDIGVVCVFEDGADNALMGYDQGRDDALFAEQQTRAAGRPSNRPIFFAVDVDVNAELSKIDGYFAGVATVLGKDHCGPYGSHLVCQRMFDQGFKWGWQTLAWSGGVIGERVQLYQYAINLSVRGYGLDYDHAFFEDYGQWQYTAPKPAPKPSMHYDWYYGPFKYKGVTLHEEELAKKYDKLRKHPTLNKKKLVPVRKDLALCADRIRGLAAVHREKGKTLPPEWAPFHRGWRYQQLAHRANGKVIKPS